MFETQRMNIKNNKIFLGRNFSCFFYQYGMNVGKVCLIKNTQQTFVSQ